VAADKKTLRRVLRSCRKALPATLVARLSKAIQERLLASAAYSRADTIALYAARENEVQTGLIFADAMASGRRVLFPRIVAPGPELDLIRVRTSADLRPGNYGLLEPEGTDLVLAESLGAAIICVPGLAFTPDGCRLGLGGGYYDSLLARVGPRSKSAGLAYSFQLLDQIPQSPTDWRLNLIFTESNTYGAPAVAEWPPASNDYGGISRC
jgi:5-formyltetrahydrofolate cyclo-ligase